MKNDPGTVEHLNSDPPPAAAPPPPPSEEPTRTGPSPHEQKMAQIKKDLGLDPGSPDDADEPELDDDQEEELEDEGVDGDDLAEELDDDLEEELEDDDELEDDEEDDPEGEADDEVTMVSLPGRFPDDDDVEVPLDRAAIEAAGLEVDQVLERFRQMRNGYGNRAQVRAERQELEEIGRSMREDPVTFLQEHVDPTTQAELAERLVMQLDDDTFKALSRKLDRWVRDPKARSSERDRSELERLKKAEKEGQTKAQRDAIASAKETIASEIDGLIPADWSPDRADRFFRLAVIEVQKHLKSKAGAGFDPEKTADLLRERGVLADYGLAKRNGGKKKSSRKADSSSAADRESATASRSKGKGGKGDARTRMSRRKRAASSPAGAGAAAASGFQKVPGERHDDRMKRLKKFLKVKR